MLWYSALLPCCQEKIVFAALYDVALFPVPIETNIAGLNQPYYTHHCVPFYVAERFTQILKTKNSCPPNTGGFQTLGSGCKLTNPERYHYKH